MLIFINLMITGIATSMLATAMTTALPPVVEYFGISMTTGQWMTRRPQKNLCKRQKKTV